MQQQEVTILRELIILLAVSLPITYIFHRVKLPALVGFLITGVLIGPYGAAVITETRVVERLADMGVVLLLFTVGLEFSIQDILRSGRQFLIGGGVQVLLTVAAVAGLAVLFHYSLPQALFFGFLASLSSTAIVLKMYSDRAELDTAHGRLSTGILLFQDIAVKKFALDIPGDIQIFRRQKCTRLHAGQLRGIKAGELFAGRVGGDDVAFQVLEPDGVVGVVD